MATLAMAIVGIRQNLKGMINCGLVKELFFMHRTLQGTIKSSLSCPLAKDFIIIEINNGILAVSYAGKKIWSESLIAEPNFFGVESCSEIAMIISMIDAGNEQWKSRCRFEP